MTPARKKIFVLLTSPWFLTFIINAIISGVFYQIKEPIAIFSVDIYLYSLFLSFWFWGFVGLADSVFTGKWSRFISGLFIAVFISFLLTATWLLYEEFALFISRDMVIDIRDDPFHIVNYFTVYASGPWGLAFAGLATFWLILWRFPGRNLNRDFIKGKKKAVALILAPALLLVGLNDIRSADARQQMVMDTAFLLAAKRSVEKVKRAKLYTSFNRLKVSERTPPDPVNIVIFLNESWSKHGLKEYGFHGKAAPFLSRWMEKEKDLFFVFRRFFANSGNTDVSVPSLFTGVASYERNDKLHEMPLLWNWAKGAGYQTFIVSSQRLTWQSLHEFLLINGPDRYYSELEIGAPMANDNGVDDLISVEYFKKVLKEASPDKPFLAVFGSNALHGPYQQTSDRLKTQPDFPVAYENALFIVDKAFEIIYEQMKSLGQLDNTVFIFTSDHCVFPLKKVIPRTFSFYDEALNIPFLIRVPPKWLESRPRYIEALRINQNRLAANIDIAPTVAAMLELEQVEENKTILKRLRGYSLLQTIPEDRITITLNSNDVKVFIKEGFGIYQGSKRFVFSTVEGPGYFDVDSDPEQNHNIWTKIDKTDKDRLFKIINNRYHLKRIFESYTAERSLRKDK